MKKLWKPALLLAAIAIMAYGVIGSGAWFTDSATATNATLYSGTLIIDDTQLSTVTLGTITNIAPGDKTGETVIVIKNNGTIPLAWFGDLQFSGSDTLYQNMYVDYAKVEYLTLGGGEWYEFNDEDPNYDLFIENGLGVGRWSTDWGTYGGVDHLAMFPAFNVNASMAPGTPYEFMGALRPGYTYRITLKFGFWEGAGNSAQGQGPLTIGFHVDATQVTLGAITALDPDFNQEQVNWLNTQLAEQTE